MFTNEFEWDASITTVMDETGENEDVQLIIEDDRVYIRQFSNRENMPADLISFTPKMFSDMLEAMNQTEGFYFTRYQKKS